MNRVSDFQSLVSKVSLVSLVLGGIFITACGKEKSSRNQEAARAADAVVMDGQNADTQVIIPTTYANCPALDSGDEEDESEEESLEEGKDGAPSEQGKGKGKDKKSQDSNTGKTCPSGKVPAPTPAPTTVPAPTPAPSPAPALDGAALYSSLCMGCHGSKAQTSIGNKSFAGIKAAMTSVGAHRNIQASTSDAQLTAISQYLMAP